MLVFLYQLLDCCSTEKKSVIYTAIQKFGISKIFNVF